LDVRRLRVLRSVITSGSVSEAAVNLGYTPSAISQQIAALQHDVGIPLFEKSGRGLRPTAAGKLLDEHASDIMARLTAAEAAIADLRDGRAGRLRVTYFATAGAALVPPAVAAFRKRCPGVQLDLKLWEPAYDTHGITDGETDVKLVVLPHGAPPEDGVRRVHLLDDPYRAVIPRGHRLARRRTFPLSELAGEPWVDPEWPPGVCRQITLDACAAAGFSPDFAVESDDYPTAIGFVAAGLGVTLVPQLALGAGHPGVLVRRIRGPEPVRSIYAAVRTDSAGSFPVEALLAAFQEAAVG
jgi:DNA-binding transcriptional LysR family regulator